MRATRIRVATLLGNQGVRRRQGAGCQRPAWACPGDGLVSASSPLLDPHHHLDLGGTYGDPETGDPIPYDELRTEHDQGVVGRNPHGRRNEAVACRRVSEVAGHGRLATVRQGGVTWPKRSL